MSTISFRVVRPPSLGTSVTSAPSALIWSSFSLLNASELTMRSRYPLAAQTRASEVPVLPPVYSTMVSPRFSRPSCSARAITVRAMRSLRLRELLCGSTRFNELRRGIPRISRTMLSARLRELLDAGVIVRSPGEGGRYALTQAGRELGGAVRELGTWGQRWLPRTLPREE